MIKVVNKDQWNHTNQKIAVKWLNQVGVLNSLRISQ